MTTYHVTRQSYWHEEGAYAVELCWPAIDYSNPGCLVAAYPEEQDGWDGFEDPREAVECAIEVLKKWRADTPNGRRKIRGITLVGPMGQFVYPALDDACTIPEARAWGQKLYDELPKCESCGKATEKEWWSDEMGRQDIVACSENCVYDLELEDHKLLDDEDCPYRDNCIVHDPEETE